MKKTGIQFWQLALVVSMLLAVLAIINIEQRTEALLQIRFRYKWLFLMAFLAAAFLLQAWLVFRPAFAGAFFEKITQFRPRLLPLKLLGAVFLLAGLPLIWLAKFAPLGKLDPMPAVTLFMVWWIFLLQSLALRWLVGLPWEKALITLLAVNGFLFQAYTTLQPVTDYPFSLGWSEASRYFYGSLPFSQSLYGQRLPLSFLHGTRYLMLSVPFLVPDLPLWADRLWQSMLWLGVTGLTAWLAIRRIPAAPRWLKWILGFWFFLFFFQGAVYYHLQVSVLIILLGVSPRHKGWPMLAVAAASFWAGMSRVNWMPVPAMLAASIYLLEEPIRPGTRWWKYLIQPAVWGVVGVASALLGQAFYIAMAGNADLAVFGSSFTSDLLWYRLWPNDTYAFGVLPGILLVTLPVAVFLYAALQGRFASLHPVRLLGLATMLLVLFAGGLLVSTKIGGGGDLHNMDAYLAMLAIIVIYCAGGRVEPDQADAPAFPSPAWSMLLILMIIPVGLALLRVPAPIRYDKIQAQQDLAVLRQTVQTYSDSGPVLFVYERHLLTFKMVPGVPLVNDYEVLTLMEMAISGNQPYLERFYRDIEAHRFSAIVMRPSNLEVSAGDFIEENNAWNELVALPIYCEYEPALALSSSNIQVYVPRAQRECPVLPEEGAKP